MLWSIHGISRNPWVGGGGGGCCWAKWWLRKKKKKTSYATIAHEWIQCIWIHIFCCKQRLVTFFYFLFFSLPREGASPPPPPLVHHHWALMTFVTCVELRCLLEQIFITSKFNAVFKTINLIRDYLRWSLREMYVLAKSSHFLLVKFHVWKFWE